MPTLTLVLDRKPVQVYDVDQAVIRVGRGEGMDIVIDNVSVSRRQAELRQEGGIWKVRDLGSANGTFVNGARLTGEQPLHPGDEISFGKFSLFFERVFTEPVAAAGSPARAGAEAGGTLHLRPEEVERIQRAAAQKRHAHLQWRVAGQRGTYYVEGGGALVGRSPLCDLRVPEGPQQHLLILRAPGGFEARNLSWWHRMKVNGRATSRAPLTSGDTIEVGGLTLTFMDEVR